jgi:hypothetical protein
MGCVGGGNGIPAMNRKDGKNDHPGYSFERAQWALVTGVGPLNFCLHRGYGFIVLGQDEKAELPTHDYDT